MFKERKVIILHTNFSEVKKMSDVNVDEADINELVDISTVNININSPKGVRLKSFIKQIKNPYLYKCGKYVVKIRFEENTATVRDRLKEYIASL